MTNVYNDDDVKATDTLGKMGEAIEDDADQTKKDVKEVGKWAGDKVADAGKATENAAEAIGVNKGDPHKDND